MPAGKDIALVAALIGDPARAAMLAALRCTPALTARELAHRAGVTPQTASSHLAKLTGAGLLEMRAEGRHRYYRLATPEVASALTALNSIAPAKRNWRSYRKSPDITFARTCYDHLAGRVGAAVTDALRRNGMLRLAADDFEVPEAGERFFATLDISLVALQKSRRYLARPCLDWTERRPHLSGSLGAAVLDRFLARGWIVRRPGVRAVIVTPSGRRGLGALLGIDIDALAQDTGDQAGLG